MREQEQIGNRRHGLGDKRGAEGDPASTASPARRSSGRTQEIQRLIGRAMRAAIDLEKLGSLTIWVDCDVLQADGGTRTAAISGAFVALSSAVRRLMTEGKLADNPLLHAVAAVSVGIVAKQPMLDLCYTEDAAAEVDFNLVMNAAGEFIELQGSGEEATFSESQLRELLALGKTGIRELLAAQQAALGRLETLLALIEGWVEVVVSAAVGDRLPGAAALDETLRRRRASGGPAEQTFATLVGLERRPRRVRPA